MWGDLARSLLKWLQRQKPNPIDQTNGDHAMYAISAPIDSQVPARRTWKFEAAGPDTRQSAQTQSQSTLPAAGDADVGAWARHAQSANGFGDGVTG